MKIEDIADAHYAELLRLNTRFVHWLSPLDRSALQTLMGHCRYARQAHDGQAFLLGYDGNSPYRHKNVDWLSARLGAYAYVDRIIVAPELAGRGVARALYADFADWARARGLGTVACEVNTEPDNPASHAFHARLGFRALGEQAYGDKAVRYYAQAL